MIFGPRISLIACLLAFAVPAPGFQDTAASIAGTVVNQATGAPISGAVVRLGDWIQETNAEGRFFFAGVNQGSFPLSADKRGFNTGRYGGNRHYPGLSSIAVTKNQQIQDIVLKLVPQAVIAGRVVDAEGDPVEGAQIVLLKSSWADGAQHWSPVASGSTLDNGEYRVAKIGAGQYLVKCTVPRIVATFDRLPSAAEKDTGYASTYYPNVTNLLSASPVDVRDGAEVRGIDIRMAPVRLFHVRFQPAAGRPPTYAALIDAADPSKVFAGLTPANPGHAMNFSRIPPGSYIAYAWWNSSPMQMTTQPLEVRDQDLENVILAPAGSEMRGRLKLKTDSPPVDLRTVSLEIRHIELDSTNADSGVFHPNFGADLSFKYPVPYQPRFVSFSVKVSYLPEGCYIASIQYGGKPVPASGIVYSSDATLEITIGSDAGRVDGVTRGKEDRPVEGGVVALIPAEGPPQSTVSGPGGAFHFAAVPPGDYKLFAWDDVSPDDIGNLEFLKRFDSQAVTVKVEAQKSATAMVPLIATETVQ